VKQKKDQPTILVAVKLPVDLNRAVHKRCLRDGIMKRFFIELAIRKFLEASDVRA
jgi:hypothetical protein